MSAGSLTGSGRLSEVARHLVLPDGVVATGFPVVRDRARALGIRYDEWQDGLGRAILAKRADGLYAAGIGGVVISICRQVGKTFTVGTIVVVLCLLFPRLKVVWTAHRARTSDETFKTMQGVVRRKRVAPHVVAVRRANGQQEIEFRNGSRIMFGARETGFGRGFDAVDVLVFDEAQILGQKALDDMVPATNAARNPLILFMGTPPKPTDPSEAFTAMRDRAIGGFEPVDGRVHRTGGDMLFVEVSADADADPDDREQWAKGNPSYRSGRVPEASVLRLKGILGDESFRREGMGIWDDPDAFDAALPVDVWIGLARADSTVVGPYSFAVDVAPDRSWASVGVAGANPWGGRHLGLAKRDRGTHWVAEYVARHAEDLGVSQVAVAARTQADYLSSALEDAGLTVVPFNRADVAAACAGFYDDLVEGNLSYTPGQEAVEQAIRGVVWTAGDARIFNRGKSSADISPLYAVILARYAHVLAGQEASYDPLRNIF